MAEMDLKETLKSRLTGVQRLGILGVGSVLRADDVAGMMLAEKLDKHCNSGGKCPPMKVFFGSTAPENLTGEIKKYEPSHLIIVDAADTGAEPGTIMFIRPEDAIGISFSTHMMPIKILIDYMLESIKCEVTIIGIQPKTLAFGEEPCPEVVAAIDELTQVLKETIAVAS